MSDFSEEYITSIFRLEEKSMQETSLVHAGFLAWFIL
jgi:acyl-coenzyme A thioesterase PaaI-like protein